jgi:hypothetical protein
MPWTQRLLEEPQALEKLLRPETPLEALLLTHPEVRRGLLWGEPRFGHPEGKVGLHVREVLDNIDRIPNIAAKERAQLRLVAISHDAFKYQEDRSRPRDWSKHHAVLARKFMEVYTEDRVVLDIIETHDDAYYAWLSVKHEIFRQENEFKSLEHLLKKVSFCLHTYYLFFKCDTQTGDKTQASVKWFERVIPNLNIVTLQSPIPNLNLIEPHE